MCFERLRAWIARKSVEETQKACQFDLFDLRDAERAVSRALRWHRRHSRRCSRGERVSTHRAVLGVRTDDRVVASSEWDETCGLPATVALNIHPAAIKSYFTSTSPSLNSILTC